MAADNVPLEFSVDGGGRGLSSASGNYEQGYRDKRLRWRLARSERATQPSGGFESSTISICERAKATAYTGQTNRSERTQQATASDGPRFSLLAELFRKMRKSKPDSQNLAPCDRAFPVNPVGKMSIKLAGRSIAEECPRGRAVSPRLPTAGNRDW